MTSISTTQLGSGSSISPILGRSSLISETAKCDRSNPLASNPRSPLLNHSTTNL
ncbi:MAG: hypothetical protein WCA35_03365 [Kovacikia sp.]